MNKLSIIIGADICPTDENINLFERGDVESLVGKRILHVLQEVDIRIFNLECPLTDDETPIQKAGPNLRAKTTAINGIKALNPSLLTLANNHVFDHGEKGLTSTINILNQNKISFIGVDSNEFIFDKKEIKIGVYACAEHEFNIESTYFDPLETPDKIKELKQKCDYVIVLYHGAKENYRYPSPLLQKRFRKMAEKGANLVVAQHTHCVGCYEKYQNSTLVYGQGNFIFNKCNNEYWDSSLLIKVNFSKNDFSVEYIPISKNNDEKQVLLDFEKRSLQINDPEFIQNEYKIFSGKMMGSYLDIIHGNTYFHKIFRKIFNINISKWFYSRKKLLHIQNIIECEAHRELFLTALNHKTK